MLINTETPALFAAIRANPDEDTPRLMLADEIESDDPDRAAFIRLQCEIATWAGPDPDVVRKAGDIVRRARAGSPVSLKANTPATKLARERLLRDKCEADWRRGPKCEECGGGGGFVYPSIFRNNICDDCFGTGDLGGLMARWMISERHDAGLLSGNDRFKCRVEYHRGMKRVHCRLEDVCEDYVGFCSHCMAGTRTLFRGPGATNPYTVDCDRCDGNGSRCLYRPTAWASAVCRHHPDVTEFWVELPFNANGGGNAWHRPSLPPFLFQLIHGHDSSTADAAHAAMARALACWVHDHLKETQQCPS